MEQVTLQSSEISCDHCIQSIEKAVAKLPGVRFISGDANSKKVVVEYDPAAASLAAIEKAMEEEGYPVSK